jgi:hypothetical protein
MAVQCRFLCTIFCIIAMLKTHSAVDKHLVASMNNNFDLISQEVVTKLRMFAPLQVTQDANALFCVALAYLIRHPGECTQYSLLASARTIYMRRMYRFFLAVYCPNTRYDTVCVCGMWYMCVRVRVCMCVCVFVCTQYDKGMARFKQTNKQI